jgi:hypothetical protein
MTAFIVILLICYAVQATIATKSINQRNKARAELAGVVNSRDMWSSLADSRLKRVYELGRQCDERDALLADRAGAVARWRTSAEKYLDALAKQAKTILRLGRDVETWRSRAEFSKLLLEVSTVAAKSIIEREDALTKAIEAQGFSVTTARASEDGPWTVTLVNTKAAQPAEPAKKTGGKR